MLYDLHGAIHCSCPAGLERVGCPHVLAVGEHDASMAIPGTTAPRGEHAVAARTAAVRRLFAEGASDQAIADELHVDPVTVRRTLQRLRQGLGVTNREELRHALV